MRVESSLVAGLPPPGRTTSRAKLMSVVPARIVPTYPKARGRWMTIAGIVTAHAILIGYLAIQTAPTRIGKAREAIVVQLLAPPEPPKPPPPQSKPLPVRKIAPIPFVAPPPVIVPDIPRVQDLPTITLPPAPPEPVVQPAIPAPVAPVAAAPAIAALVPPRYDAAYLDNPAPVYPAIARRQHEEGRVLLRVLVSSDGRAESVDIATSSGSERLDRAAIDAVRRWRFVPARRGSEAVAAHVNVPIVFSLDRG